MRATNLCLILLAALFTPAASASVPTLDPALLSERLAGIPFGETLEPVMKHVETRLRAEYAEQLRTQLDTARRDRIAREIEVRVRAVRDSLVQFTGQRTGYNVSVVGKEFVHGAKEAMLVVPAGRSHDYYFFSDGRLWKVVTAEVDVPEFATFLLRLKERFGQPSEVKYEEPEARKDPLSARWVTGALKLTATARPEYGVVTMRFESVKWAESVAAARASSGSTADDAEGLDPSILDIMQD